MVSNLVCTSCLKRGERADMKVLILGATGWPEHIGASRDLASMHCMHREEWESQQMSDPNTFNELRPSSCRKTAQ